MLKSPSTSSVTARPRDAASVLELLYEQYQALVLRTAYLMLGDWAEAEDVAQEVWLAVSRHLDSFDPEKGAWTTWLHRITVNRCLNVQRRLKRWWSHHQLEGVPEPATASPQPLEALVISEEGRRLWVVVQRLPLKQRAVVVLRYYHDLRYEEIAQVLDCPLGTVRSRLHTAHTKLRELLSTL